MTPVCPRTLFPVHRKGNDTGPASVETRGGEEGTHQEAEDRGEPKERGKRIGCAGHRKDHRPLCQLTPGLEEAHLLGNHSNWVGTLFAVFASFPFFFFLPLVSVRLEHEEQPNGETGHQHNGLNEVRLRKEKQRKRQKERGLRKPVQKHRNEARRDLGQNKRVSPGIGTRVFVVVCSHVVSSPTKGFSFFCLGVFVPTHRHRLGGVPSRERASSQSFRM